MATVPSSGTLSMKSMAQEALHGTYGSGTIVNPISLYDMINSGDASSGDDYPEVNTDCTPNPTTRGYLVLENVDYGSGAGPLLDYYYSGGVGAASNLTVGHTLYTDTALTTPVSSQWYEQDGLTGDTKYHCNTGLFWSFSTNSDGGIIYSSACSYPP